MNVKKFTTIVFCVIGVCLAVISGLLVAAKMIAPGNGAELEPIKGRVNILVMGVDEDLSRSDTIMLVSIDSKNHKLSFLSIPRDTRVLYDRKYDKITHLIGYKGNEMNTIRAVKEITGIPIHYYAKINFEGFRNIIDILGGVVVDVPNVKNGGMYYDDPAQNLHIALKAGKQQLNGSQAEGFVRYRSGYADADLGRIKTQQTFVKELLAQKLKPQYFLKATQIYKEVRNNVETNYSVGNITKSLRTIRNLSDEDIHMFSLPGEGQYASTRYGNVSCFVYDKQKTNDMIAEYFSEKSK